MDPFSLELAAAQAPSRVALVAEGRTFTFRALADQCRAIADELERMRGDREGPIAVRAVNHASTALVLLALIDRGIPFVPLHPRLTDHEASALVADARCSLVLDASALSGLVDRASSNASPRAVARAPIDPESPLAILYTSGTTGTPKGAVLSRRAFAASAAASAANLSWTDSDRWLLCLPLCHVGGLSVLTRCVAARRTIVLVPRFDERLVADAIVAHAVTIASFVPTMLLRMLEGGHAPTLADLRAVLLGGAAAPTSLLEACAARRIRVRTTYGLTEACSQVTTQRERDPSVVDVSSGEPLSGVELEIVRDDGTRCAADEVGAIALRGATLFSGYFNGPARDRGAWFDTGDFGMLDDRGRLHVVARRTDLIVTGGENVYPLEVERALSAVPGITAIMVFGVEDARWGQRVACAIVAEGGAPNFDAALFRAECERRLAAHKRPRAFVLCDELPLTSAGKPDRRAAAARFAGQTRDLVSVTGPQSTE